MTTSSNVVGRFEIAQSNGYYFTDVQKDDVVIRTGTSSQNIVLGTDSNARSALNIAHEAVYVHRPLSSLDYSPIRIHGVSVDVANQVRLDAIKGATWSNRVDILSDTYLHGRLLDGTGSNMLRLGGVTFSNDTMAVAAIKPLAESSHVAIAASSFSTDGVVTTDRIRANTVEASNLVLPGDQADIGTITVTQLRARSNVTFLDTTLRFMGPTDSNEGITMSNGGTLTARRIRVVDALESATGMAIQAYPGISTSNLTAQRVQDAAFSNTSFETSLLPATSNIDIGSSILPFNTIHVTALDIAGQVNLDYTASNARLTGAALQVPQLILQGSSNLMLSIDSQTGFLRSTGDAFGSVVPGVRPLRAQDGSIKIGLGSNPPSGSNSAATLQVDGVIYASGDIQAAGHIHVPGYSNDAQHNRLFQAGGSETFFEFQSSTAQPLVRLTNEGQLTVGLQASNNNSEPASLVVHGGLEVTRGDVKYSQGDLFVSGDIYYQGDRKLGGTNESGTIGPSFLFLTSNAMVFDVKSSLPDSAFRFTGSNTYATSNQADLMHVNASNGYVGFMTSSPTERLDVAEGNVVVRTGDIIAGCNLEIRSNMILGKTPSDSNAILVRSDEQGMLSVRHATSLKPAPVLVSSIAFKPTTTTIQMLPGASDPIALLHESLVALQARVAALEARLV